MSNEIIYTRADGTKVKVSASFYAPYLGKPEWEIRVSVCPPKKRTWVGVYSGDDYMYRRLDQAGKNAYVMEKQLMHCTKEEMLAAKLQLWESMKPE